MDPFVEQIVAVVHAGLRAQGVEPPEDGLAGRIEQPPDPALGDYALPCFPFAKLLRKAPQAIATELAERLAPEVEGSELLRSVEAAGPYLNFRVDPEAMAVRTVPAVLSGAYFAQNREQARPRVMVEYSQPNTHKAFHVGHMRNVALGDALVRILEYNGHEVIAANYIGDVGTHIARCLWFYMNHRAELGEEAEPPPADDPDRRGEWLGLLYTAATNRIEDAPDEDKQRYLDEVSAVLQDLEAERGEAMELWRETRQWSLAAFDAIYAWLGARFDEVFYESEMGAAGKAMVEKALADGVFVRSQGAIGVDMEPWGLGFFLALKADGTTLYATKDLALARQKFERYGIQRSIYVVGAEQTLHFQQVFKALALLGYEQASDCHHLAYGLVMLPEGKMSSRAGNIIPFSRMRAEMDAFIRGNYLDAHQGDWEEAEIAETARRIAVAAIRYGMVKQDPGRNIVFDMRDWLVSEGDTGTYLCYAYTRIQSILRNVEQARGFTPQAEVDYALLTHEQEKQLVRALHDFNGVVERAGESLRPNMVANALYQLCQVFSRTYTHCPVLRAESEALARARLALFAATGRVLEEGLGLIGITPPSRM